MLDSENMPNPLARVDYGLGMYMPAMFHYSNEWETFKIIAADNGYEIRAVEVTAPNMDSMTIEQIAKAVVPPGEFPDGWEHHGVFKDGQVYTLQMRKVSKDG